MLSDASVMEDSQAWVSACDVQQRFMRGVDRADDTWDYGARCRQVHELGGDCYDVVLQLRRSDIT
jgi:serine phosphatase RsbU (regulator of sigma subunit)